MGTPLSANEYAEHEVLVCGDAFLPLVHCGNGDAELGADIHDSAVPFIVRNQCGKHEWQAVWAVWDDNIQEQGMRGLAGRA